MPTIDALPSSEKKTMKDVKTDVRRTMPEIPVFAHNIVQCMLSRILFIWAMKHPASGYVQGINDLTTPFILVFLGEQLQRMTDELSEEDMERVTDKQMRAAEADVYWCLNRVLEEVQDNFIEG